jgi:hypothetical protein
MSAQKKRLSLEGLEAQMLLELPDRELMHVSKHHLHHRRSATMTTFSCGSQDNSGGHYVSHHGRVFAPVNVHIRSCGPKWVSHFRGSFFFRSIA